MEYFGSEAINVHYQSRNKQQLIDFIENIVLQEQDDMKKFVINLAETLLNEAQSKCIPQNNAVLEKELLSS
jgi:hypothetical protein